MKSLTEISKKHVLVIGDVMLDTYYGGTVERISPEAPVPVFKKRTERRSLGGAANVAANLVSAGQKVSILTAIGKDSRGDLLTAILKETGINTDLIISVKRNTTEKIRFLANNNQQVLRLDIEDTEEMDPEICQILLMKLEQSIALFDLIIISDYLKGLLTYAATQGVIQLANKNGIPLIIDVKDPKIDKYKGAYLVKPNLKELQALTGMEAADDQSIVEASEALRKRCGCSYVLATCGARGMVLVGDGKPFFIDSAGQEVFDVTGAGDTAIAYLAACMANGFCMRESVEIANFAAGIQVSKVGTSPVYWHEVRECLIGKKEGIIHKILSKDALNIFREEHKDQKVVFTNGCFDILHIGHIRYMQQAAKMGDILVVGINSDASVKRLKGSKRPINSEQDRIEMMCALSFVDYVILFEEDTPYDLISIIQPDVLVKGGDYNEDNVIGADIVKARGGKLILIPFIEGKSTTNMIEKITVGVNGHSVCDR